MIRRGAGCDPTAADCRHGEGALVSFFDREVALVPVYFEHFFTDFFHNGFRGSVFVWCEVTMRTQTNINKWGGSSRATNIPNDDEAAIKTQWL